jgi:hypothetical protein
VVLLLGVRNRLIFHARQQLMTAFFRASSSSTNRTCGSMKRKSRTRL